MLVSDGYGKVVNMSLEVYLDLTDEEWQDEVIAGNWGDQIDDPFYNLASKHSKVDIKSIELPDEDLEIEKE